MSDFAEEVVRAFYAGVPDREQPDRDSSQLRGIAEWMDRIDDLTDAESARNGRPYRVGRGMQADLLRIAARLDEVEKREGWGR